MIKVKICGITNNEDAQRAAVLGASALGFVFYKKSPRDIGAYKARKIIDGLPPFVVPVGVFVNQKEGAVKQIAEFCGLKTLQFHGDETPEYCRRFSAGGYKVIKAFRVSDTFDFDTIDGFKNYPILCDAHKEGQFGGTGKTFNWKLAAKFKKFGQPIILSGGLNPSNIVQAIAEAEPYAVDVSSGVEEAPGKKSDALLTQFFQKIHFMAK